MKRYLFIFFFCIASICYSQVTINPQLPPDGLMHKEQLWSLVLVNNTNSEIKGNLFLSLQEKNSGQTVFTALTRTITLTKGAKLLTVNDILPIQYNFGIGAANTSYLPMGVYIACYTLIKFKMM